MILSAQSEKMDFLTAARIFDAHNESTKWTTGSIWLSVCMDTRSPDTQEFDFATTIGKKKSGPSPLLPVRLWLPPRYNENDKKYREETIAPLFSTACVQAGFELIIRGWEPARNCLRFCCHRGKKHSDTARAKRHLKVCCIIIACYILYLLYFLRFTHTFSDELISCVAPKEQHHYKNKETDFRRRCLSLFIQHLLGT